MRCSIAPHDETTLHNKLSYPYNRKQVWTWHTFTPNEKNMKPLEKYTIGFTLGQFNFLSPFLFWRQTSNKYPGLKKKKPQKERKHTINLPKLLLEAVEIRQLNVAVRGTSEKQASVVLISCLMWRNGSNVNATHFLRPKSRCLSQLVTLTVMTR